MIFLKTNQYTIPGMAVLDKIHSRRAHVRQKPIGFWLCFIVIAILYNFKFLLVKDLTCDS